MDSSTLSWRYGEKHRNPLGNSSIRLGGSCYGQHLGQLEAPVRLRMIVDYVDETFYENDQDLAVPAVRAVALAVIANPWYGAGYVHDLSPLIDEVAPELGALLSERVVSSLGRPVEAYGKAAIVGAGGEVEHASGLIHTLKFGDFYRKATNGTTLLPAVEKRAMPGAHFDIPLKHVTDATVRSHHQSIEVSLPDAPHHDEILVGLAAAAQGRPLSRLPAFGSDAP